MLVLYFSGTGNSKYIAGLLGKYMEGDCFSIESDLNFAERIEREETIAFCYPVYGSRVPRIMRAFVQTHMEPLRGKKLVVMCTQLVFSGDGARAFADIFPRGHVEVIYAEHFRMPNNVCNVFFLPQATPAKLEKTLERADRNMRVACDEIKSGVVRKRGFNIVSRTLGLTQGLLMPGIERKSMASVRIREHCTRCGICAGICPMGNLSLERSERGGVALIHKGDCTMCYRCVNQCPQKAITVFFHGTVKKQYGGV